MIKIQRVRNPHPGARTRTPARGNDNGNSNDALASLGVDLAGADDEFNYGIIKNLVIFCCGNHTNTAVPYLH
jgi:hypothetical protein